ncbi:histidine phosphatase family protein [Microbispora sp. H11081]|uniref:histidine phosphatase family protein n=1 Tax=Microbispora sp. H11081 TaxID=2729107 RepID=UPI001472ACA3|nr:histidine phosphatase family protein [Microbispora sp. H11081]
MLFVRHATTPGTRAARFPADEDADAASLARATALALAARTPARETAGTADAMPGPMGFTGVTTAWTAPVRAARQTAAALGLAAYETAALGEADCGRWRGLPYERIAREEPDALALWLADPDVAPHGGEPLTAHAARVARWLDSVREAPEGVAVCGVGTIRAALAHALGLGPFGAARFDLAPLSTTRLTATRDGWRIAHVNRRIQS